MPNAPEAATIEFLKSHAKGTRVLTLFSWAEYAIWHLGPDILVSMDGRRETVYSADFVDAHFQFYRNAPDAPAFATRLGADFVWLPSDRPVTATLIKEGWHPVFRGPVSTILSRKPGLTILGSETEFDNGAMFSKPLTQGRIRRLYSAVRSATPSSSMSTRSDKPD